jgi:hypothetical protein
MRAEGSPRRSILEKFMTVSEDFGKGFESFPPLLRELLDAAAAAGSELAGFGHGFPAPPAGACRKLDRPVTTRPHASGGGLQFRGFPSSRDSGGLSGERGFFCILEPSASPLPEPDMDAIRAALAPAGSHPARRTETPPPASHPPPASAFPRFVRRRAIDADKWHDGEGCDLDALRDAAPAGRTRIEALLVQRGAHDGRQVDAFAALAAPPAGEVLRAMKNPGPGIRLVGSRRAPGLLQDRKRVASLLQAPETAEFYGGLSQALHEAEDVHPPENAGALRRRATPRRRGGRPLRRHAPVRARQSRRPLRQGAAPVPPALPRGRPLRSGSRFRRAERQGRGRSVHVSGADLRTNPRTCP